MVIAEKSGYISKILIFFCTTKNMTRTIIFFLLTGWIPFSMALAQDEPAEDKALESLLGNTESESVLSTFKGTRLINAHTVDFQHKNELQFCVLHRFGTLNSGAQQYFGLHNAYARFGFEYGVLENWAVGIGTSSQERIADLYQKLRLIRQKSGGFPVSVVYYAAVFYRGAESYNFVPLGVSLQARHFMSYTHQLLIASKVTSRISLQFMPGFYHHNLVPNSQYLNTVPIIGTGARFKLTHRLSVIADYFWLADAHAKAARTQQEIQRGESQIFEPLSVGLEIETGGHVFQLVFSNSRGMTDATFLGETRTSWADSGIHFGFNLHRNFNLRKR